MRWPRRPGLLLAVVGAALFSTPGGSRGTRLDPWIGPPEYATVGRIVSRRVDGRTIVLIPVAGPVRPHLSEPFLVGSRWRLYLTLEGARVGINARPRPGQGVLSVTVTETGSDVRIAVDVASLTSYGTKPAEEGLLLWIEDEETAAHDAEEQAAALPIIGDGPRLSSPPVAPEPDPGYGRWARLLLWLIAVAGAGIAVRWWKRQESLPRWMETAGGWVAGHLTGLRSKVPGRATETEVAPGKDSLDPDGEPEPMKLRKTG